MLLQKDGKHDVPLIPTGNVDIFDIKCTCPEGQVCNDTEGKPSTPVIKPIDDHRDKENDILGFNIFDNQVHWEMESELKIFSHPAYKLEQYIAPGYTNTYEYRVRNNNNFKVIYTMLFEEENDKNINMKYRLKKNNEFIVGDNDNWVDYSELNTTSIIIDENKVDTYLLDWKWVEGTFEDDTQYGISDIEINYGLTIEIVGIEYEDS